MYNLCLYFFMFYCYAIFGWTVECITCSIGQKKFVHDRGFLIGPYCPIYGYGAMYMYFFLNRYYHEPITLFVMAVVGTSFLEYITSYLMEKLFNARWWDYSNERFNLEGRICLRNAVAFLFVVNKIQHLVLIIISIILFISFLIDNILTFTIMNSLKSKLANVRQDSTSDIDKQVREILSKHTFYINKLFKSFPKVKFSFPFGEQLMNSIRETLDNMNAKKKERKKRIKELKHELKKESKK